MPPVCCMPYAVYGSPDAIVPLVRRLAAVVFLLFLLLPADAATQTRRLHLGARAAAMGGAFTGVADDSTGFYWNPAGIAFGSFLAAGFYRGEDESDRDGRLFEDRASGLALNYTFMGVAFTEFRQRTSAHDGSSGLDTFDVAVSVLQSLPVDNLVVAGNVHYLSGTTVLGRQELQSDSWDVDIGVMYEPARDVRFGLMVSHLREARFDLPNDGRLRVPRHARAGVSFRLPRAYLVAVDVDLSNQGPDTDERREISLGAEKAIFERRAFVRGGVRVETGSELGSRPAFSVGAGVQIWVLRLEGAYRGSSESRDEGYWFGISLAR